MKEADVFAVFSQLGIPLAEQGKQKIQETKNQFFRRITNEHQIRYRITASDGTGKQETQENAKLERSPF